MRRTPAMIAAYFCGMSVALCIASGSTIAVLISASVATGTMLAIGSTPEGVTS
jgi:hypothetical protein